MSDAATYSAGTHYVARPTRPLRTPRSRYWKDFIKLCWTGLGARIPDAALNKARVWLDYLYTARWLETHGLAPKRRVQGGREVFRAVAGAYRPAERANLPGSLSDVGGVPLSSQPRSLLCPQAAGADASAKPDLRS